LPIRLQLAYHMSLHLGDGRLRGAENKWARDPNILEHLADDPFVEREKVGIDIREFGHFR
jgi:hypothetical protein